LKIVHDYPGSSINVIEIKNQKIVLELKKEKNHARQYFNFQLVDVKKKCNIIITNASKTQFAKGYENYLPFYKTNGNWERFDEKNVIYDGEALNLTISKNDHIEISLVPRYTMEDLLKFTNSLDKNKFFMSTTKTLTEIKTNNDAKPICVFIARQHPGETLSSFFLEGVIRQLEQEVELKYQYIFYPIVNTRGVENGCHRYYEGIDYNRSWTKELPEEIVVIMEKLREKNIKYFFDIHCDEVTKFDYIRTNSKKIKEKLNGTPALAFENKFVEHIKSMIKTRRKTQACTTKDHIEKNLKCKYILFELSMHKSDNILAFKSGKKTAENLNEI